MIAISYLATNFTILQVCASDSDAIIVDTTNLTTHDIWTQQLFGNYAKANRKACKGIEI